MDTILNNPTWQVTALDPDPRDPDRVLVTVAPDAAAPGMALISPARTLALHIAVVVRAGLRAGLALAPGQLGELQAADDFQRIYNRALDFLAVRPRSEQEVRDRLRRKGIADPDIAQVQERLRRAGYLDDAAFARYWIGERARSSPRGARLLQQELRRKGVNSAVIAEALAEFATARPDNAAPLLEEDMPEDEIEDEDAAPDAEFDAALGLAQRKHRTYASLDDATYRRRMSGFLLRRGYSYGLISKVLKTLRDGGDDD